MSFDRQLLTEIKYHFKKSDQTNWGKNQIVSEIDSIERQLLQEKKRMDEDMRKAVLISAFTDSSLLKGLIE